MLVSIHTKTSLMIIMIGCCADNPQADPTPTATPASTSDILDHSSLVFVKSADGTRGKRLRMEVNDQANACLSIVPSTSSRILQTVQELIACWREHGNGLVAALAAELRAEHPGRQAEASQRLNSSLDLSYDISLCA